VRLKKEDKFPLSDVVVELRRELLEAQRKAAEARLKFEVQEIELELQVGTGATGKAGFGVAFWVYSAEAEGEISRESLQTVRLKLKPVETADDESGDPTEQPVRIRGKVTTSD
jgi:hypothetical protein